LTISSTVLVYADKLREAGVAVTELVLPGAVHAFFGAVGKFSA
jgi:acetyl esterase/lipase